MSGSLTLQGRQLGGDDIGLIRQLIGAHPDWHRSRLSVELCRMWNWRTDKGLLKDMACRSMLRKLEQRRLIVLPAARVIGNRARRIREMAHASDPKAYHTDWREPIQVVIQWLNEQGRKCNETLPIYDATMADIDGVFQLLESYLAQIGAGFCSSTETSSVRGVIYFSSLVIFVPCKPSPPINPF